MKDAALFVMPRSAGEWRGAEALWVTVAGWARAAEMRFGSALIITTDRVSRPEGIDQILAPAPDNRPSAKLSLSKFVPQLVITLLKDLRLFLRRRSPPPGFDQSLEGVHIRFVWEQHDLFSGPGKELSVRLGVPLIIFVHAPVVWEAARWGIRRPLWGRLLERNFEARSLKRADLVACVSDEVAGKLIQMGVDREKIVVSPMAVDMKRFSADCDCILRKQSQLPDSKLVVGWVGSFRRFHGLGSLVEAFAKVRETIPDTVLMLIGGGLQQDLIRKRVEELGMHDSVLFTGRVPHAEIPSYMACFDLTVVSAEDSSNFHYSPLKLREYMAMKKAVVAPRAGEIVTSFNDGENILLYDPGDTADLVKKLLLLMGDPVLRERIGRKGFEKIKSEGTWGFELEKVLGKLRID